MSKDDTSLLIQHPLFDLSYLDLFNLKIAHNNQEWDKFLDDTLLLRYSYMRICFQENNLHFFAYFLNFLEGSFM